MNKEYSIIDQRELGHYKKETFSGFKKLDVLTALFKNIESNKIEAASYWVTECIISGYIFEVLDKLLIFSSKIIHINSPRLPHFLLKKTTYFDSITKHITKKDDYIHLRNTQTIRNLFFDLITTLCTSPKNKRYDKYPKIKPETDFNFQQIQNKLIATMQCTPSHIIRFSDPEELRIIINEIYYNLKNNLGSYERIVYWILWLFEWEKHQKKINGTFEIEERDIKDIPKRYQKDVVWLLWEVIIDETNTRNKNIQQQVFALYQLFKRNFSSGKKNSRLPLLFHVIGYLTHTINFEIPIRINKSLFVQSQCNVNLMFQSKKINEKNSNIQPIIKKQKPPKENIAKEKCLDKLNLLNDFDSMIFNK